MTKRKQDTRPPEPATEASEPVGIVISSGIQDAAVPRFAAYVWGPVPDADSELVAVA
jgi:hypothetical protein